MTNEEENYDKISNRLEVDASNSRLHRSHAYSSITDGLKFVLPVKLDVRLQQR